MRTELRRALVTAIKAHDSAAASALRSALAAIENAEAVETPDVPSTGGDANFAASNVGLGAGEKQRRALSDADEQDVVRAEILDRRSAANDYERLDRRGAAERLRAEADALAAYLPDA